MATFLDRLLLKRVLEAALQVRRMETRVEQRPVTVYLARAVKGPKFSEGNGYLAQRAHNAIHEAAVQAFGGWIVREMPDGLVSAFEDPDVALRAALHALHAIDDARAMVPAPPTRVSLAHGEAPLVNATGVSGSAFQRASRLLGRARAGEVVFEPDLLKVPLAGYHDIMMGVPRRGRIPGLGTVTTVTARPLGLKPELDEELEQVDAELRARNRKSR